MNLLGEINKEDGRGWATFANTPVVLFTGHGPRIGSAMISKDYQNNFITKICVAFLKIRHFCWIPNFRFDFFTFEILVFFSNVRANWKNDCPC